LSHWGFLGLNFMILLKSTWATGAMPLVWVSHLRSGIGSQDTGCCEVEELTSGHPDGPSWRGPSHQPTERNLVSKSPYFLLPSSQCDTASTWWCAQETRTCLRPWRGRERAKRGARLAGAGFFLLRGAATYREDPDRVDRELVDVGVSHVCGFLD
jgi:hypothetical protein